jgi:hypothetical protein
LFGAGMSFQNYDMCSNNDAVLKRVYFF